jgi:hypothetical protein
MEMTSSGSIASSWPMHQLPISGSVSLHHAVTISIKASGALLLIITISGWICSNTAHQLLPYDNYARAYKG